MISLITFYSFACLICFQTINLSSARLAFNQKFSIDSVAISDAIREKTNKLVPIGTLWGGTTGDQFGQSVSLSYDGDELAVGSPWYVEGELSNVGLAQIFHRKNSLQWIEVLNVTGGNEYDNFGVSTSLSGDGKWLSVGTDSENGYVKLVETETGKEIKIDGDESDRVFGHSVAVSHDGNRTAVAAYDYVRVFGKEEDGSIFQIGEDILTDDWSTVALSADGETLAMGEYSYDNNKGRVRIFKMNSGEWKQVGGDMVGENEYDSFGYSLDITADGHRVVIGTYGGNYVKVYDYDGSGWEVVGGKLSGEPNDQGSFGRSVSISDDESRIVIGSPYFAYDGIWFRGRAAVYQFESGDWNQVGDDILGMNANDEAGYSVAISVDGNIVSIGAPYADSYRGYVMIYELN